GTRQAGGEAQGRRQRRDGRGDRRGLYERQGGEPTRQADRLSRRDQSSIADSHGLPLALRNCFGAFARGSDRGGLPGAGQTAARGQANREWNDSIMTELTLTHFLVLGAFLFACGILCIVTKRNAIGILMGVELVLNAANVNFVAFARYSPAFHLE